MKNPFGRSNTSGIFHKTLDAIAGFRRWLDHRIPCSINPRVVFFQHHRRAPAHSILFLPPVPNVLCCGLAGIVSYKRKHADDTAIDPSALERLAEEIVNGRFSAIQAHAGPIEESSYLGGEAAVRSLCRQVQTLKCKGPFQQLVTEKGHRRRLAEIAGTLHNIIEVESECLSKHMGRLSAREVDIMSRRIDKIKDIEWAIRVEVLENIKKILDLFPDPSPAPTRESALVLKNINAVLNSIDRLEVRGRDSAGISLLFWMEPEEFESFRETLENTGLMEPFEERKNREVLVNGCIVVHSPERSAENGCVCISMTYKVAAEIGSLGDNVIALRWQIKNDPILQTLIHFSHRYRTILSHTRWASVGAITEANCHPVDNRAKQAATARGAVIHVCLNGDIDNYLELKTELEAEGILIHDEITTDTKIIPLNVERYVRRGHGVEEAFRLAVNDFEGSHAIAMHTDLAPGKLFLAQRGSGQTIFIGLAEDHFIPASEVYGFVEETPRYIKMEGEKLMQKAGGGTRGQIIVLQQEAQGPEDGMHALYYDGTPLPAAQMEIKHTEITSRDIDRREFPHYFLKEIHESPDSVERTLQNRWKTVGGDRPLSSIQLEESTLPKKLETAIVQGRIRRVFFVGQGTAGVAALCCANILDYYLNDPHLNISAMKASELSGFKLDTGGAESDMKDALVVAISQSGTTTDTNRTVDMVRERGAFSLAIVNRRDSDITFKVDGVMYTSSGRDIEMSVASTKAFYSQIVAGAVLGLKMAELTGRRSAEFISSEIERLLELPDHMRNILALGNEIRASAERLATTKTYWAAVGSGPNKASADEIRIKLSELCYKTISADYIEDKKHIDLSSEPLIIVCAAGTRPTVIGDIIKDTAIFKAHKATPVVIADEKEHRFDPYAADVFRVPVVAEHLAPIVNTLVGHIWGYHAALTINEGSRFLYAFRENLQQTIEDGAQKGLNVFELVLEKSFREKIVRFYREFRQKKAANELPTAIGLEAASDITLLLKYLAGKLPVPDFEVDFARKGTALNMINALMACLGDAINIMARPVDAIKHQAKTVTVGTSRISETVEGILFDALSRYDIGISQITSSNILVLKNLQDIVDRIEGAILYKIGNLDLLGEPTEDTTIEVVLKEGALKPIPSRVETDNRLKGTKRIIVREKNVWIGVGKKDDRTIIVVPVLSDSPSTTDIIEFLLLLNISFKEDVSLATKIKALGGKFERIVNIVQESSVSWADAYIEWIEMKELFGLSAEKIGDKIVSKIS